MRRISTPHTSSRTIAEVPATCTLQLLAPATEKRGLLQCRSADLGVHLRELEAVLLVELLEDAHGVGDEVHGRQILGLRRLVLRLLLGAVVACFSKLMLTC